MSVSDEVVSGEVKVVGSPAEVKVEAIPGEVVVSPDPLARAKRVARKGWPYAAALVVLLAAAGGLFRHDLDWGDFPTWAMAVTTLLALLAAAFAGLVAYDVLQIEVARDLKASDERLQAAADRRQAANDRLEAQKEREEARRAANDERAAQREADRRAQASKVTAWFAFYHRATGEPILGDQVVVPIGTATWGGVVRNAYELPIFDVRLFYFRVIDQHDGSPWTTENVYASTDRMRVVPPHQTRSQELPARVRDRWQDCNDEVYVVGVEFTDANGARWYRNERAVLEPR